MTNKLSPTQKAVLSDMKPGQWYSAYNLQCSLATLEALTRRGLVKQRTERTGDGYIFDSRVSVKFRLVVEEASEHLRIKELEDNPCSFCGWIDGEHQDGCPYEEVTSPPGAAGYIFGAQKVK